MKQEDAAENRKWILAIMAILIIVYAGWTLLLVFAALMAESGGKNSEPLLALALLWPLGELVWTWVWVKGHAQQYLSSKRRLGNLLMFAALIAPPLTFLLPRSWGRDWPVLIPMLVTIAGCWAARLVWSRTQAPEPSASSG
jgi:hypothetical protein